MYGPPGLADIEQLTGREPAPDREPGELAARVLHHAGLADAPPRRPDPGAPDVSGLRRELGL
jgi:hypothetical protein